MAAKGIPEVGEKRHQRIAVRKLTSENGSEFKFGSWQL